MRSAIDVVAEKLVAIQAHEITARLGNTEVLSNSSIDFPRGRWTSIVGPNGAGKSTLLKVLAGLTPFTGSVELLSQPFQTLLATTPGPEELQTCLQGLKELGPRDKARPAFIHTLLNHHDFITVR